MCSRTLKPSERNYSVICREALAIRYAFEKFDPVVYGYPVIIITDQKPLVRWKFCNVFPNKQMQEWWLTCLHQYDVLEIIYRDGKENGLADALSRMNHKAADNSRLDVQPDVRLFMDEVADQAGGIEEYRRISTEESAWDRAVQEEELRAQVRRQRVLEEYKKNKKRVRFRKKTEEIQPEEIAVSVDSPPPGPTIIVTGPDSEPGTGDFATGTRVVETTGPRDRRGHRPG